MRATKIALGLGLALGLASCGTTGGELFEVDAYAAGPEDAVAGQPYQFRTNRGFDVVLDKAVLHIGAVYLNKTEPTSVASDTSCYLAGLYVAEVTSGLDVNVLDPEPQPFPSKAFATSERAHTAEIWLSGGDIEATSDPTIIAEIEGTATKDGESYPFSASITIGDNRKLPATDPALPGASPICKTRIVTPISVDLTPTATGTLVVRVDPKRWFSNVAFDQLEKKGDRFEFRDDSFDQPSRNLFNGLRANDGVYEVGWEEP